MGLTVTVQLGDDLADALQREAQKLGLSMEEIARRAIAERLQKSGRSSVIARRFGMMSGPPDLSTNKLYRRALARAGR